MNLKVIRRSLVPNQWSNLTDYPGPIQCFASPDEFSKHCLSHDLSWRRKEAPTVRGSAGGQFS